MAPPIKETRQCQSCKTWYTVHKNEVSVRNTGILICPICEGEVVDWTGHFFYTLGVDPPASTNEMDVVVSD